MTPQLQLFMVLGALMLETEDKVPAAERTL